MCIVYNGLCLVYKLYNGTKGVVILQDVLKHCCGKFKVIKKHEGVKLPPDKKVALLRIK